MFCLQKFISSASIKQKQGKDPSLADFLSFMDQAEIKSLVYRLQEGCNDAFAGIYDRYWEKLYDAAYQRTRSREASEEIVQEVFLTLWRRKADLNIQCLSSYLAAMVRHSVYRFMARRQAKLQLESSFYENSQHITDLRQIMEDRLALDKILELSNQLPEKCRLVFQYNKLDDQPLDVVAKRLNISPKTAEAHLTKALKIIRLSVRDFRMFL